MSSGKCRRTSTLQASPRAAAAKNQFALESPTSSQSPPRQGRRDALRNLVFKGAGRRSTTYRGVRYREELDKYVSEIRPTRCSKKIWLGTYDTAEEAARAFDIGNLCCKKNLPLNFPDSPSMLKKISSGLSPEDARRAIAKLAKEVAHLEVTNRNLAPRTPERDEHHHDLLVQPAAASNQFIHHFASNQSIHQFASNQSVHHLAASGNSSHMYIEQLDDHIECAMEVATAMPIAGGGRSGSRSWEFQIGDVSLKDDLEDIPDLMDHYGDVFYLY